MRWLCYLAPALYLMLCATSVAALFFSTEPLVGLYAVFLAWPWTFVFDMVNSSSFLVNIALAASAFLANAALLFFSCRVIGALFRRTPNGGG